MGDVPRANAATVVVVLALLLAWSGAAAAEKATWSMHTTLCTSGEGQGSFALRVEGDAAWLGGFAFCPGYSHQLDYGPLPLVTEPDGTRKFVDELAVLTLDAQGRFVSWDEYNDFFSTWIHFHPA